MTDDLSPEAPEPIAPAPVTHVTKAPRRAPLLVVLALLVVVGVGAALLAVRGGGERDAGEALAAARSAVREAGSFRFSLRTTDVLVEGDSENGTETTTRSSERGEWSDGVWHTTSESEGWVAETITEADGTTYVRDGEDGDDLAGAQWDRFDGYDELVPEDMAEMLEEMAGFDGELFDDELLGEAYADEAAVTAAAAVYLSGEGETSGGGPFAAVTLGGEPTGFLDAIEEMGKPEMQGAGTLVATLRAGDDLVEAFGRPLPDGRVELDLGPDDLPVALRLRVEAPRASAAIELAFSDWDAPIEIAVPGDDEIDPTPWVEEEELAALAFTPVLPSSVPDGWEPSLVEVLDADDYYFEGDLPEGCQLLDVDYGEPFPEDDDADLGYAWLYQTSRDCALAADDAPFEPGGPGGLPSRESDLWSVEVLVGDTAVGVDATLEGAELDALVASLAPVDVQALVDVASEMAAGWYSPGL